MPDINMSRLQYAVNRNFPGLKGNQLEPCFGAVTVFLFHVRSLACSAWDASCFNSNWHALLGKSI